MRKYNLKGLSNLLKRKFEFKFVGFIVNIFILIVILFIDLVFLFKK